MHYLPYLVVLLLFLILFVLSRGLFDQSSGYLLARFPILKNYVSRETLKKMLLLVFAANLIGILLTWKSLSEETVSKGFLLRNEYGESDEQTELTVDLSGEKQEVDLTISSRKLSPAEIGSAISKAEAALPDLLFSAQDPKEIRKDLSLPETIGTPAVSVNWETSDPLLMDWDGNLGSEIPKEGAGVTLTAVLSLEGQEKEAAFDLRVFPRAVSEEEAFQTMVREAVDGANDETEAKVVLPGRIDGRDALWSRRTGSDGLSFLLLGILIAAMYAYSKVRRAELSEEKREEEMLIDYPNIVSKLVLLLSAGMSLRKAIARIRKDYEDSLIHGGEARPGYEEITRVILEMEHGVSEITAYENMGKRSRVPQYRTFSTLLVQNLTKGGSEMASVLKREAEDAFEERKKRARVLGEQAGTKLLLPMLLMLVIVMAILMVPAFLTFF